MQYTRIIYASKARADEIAHEICVLPSGMFLHCTPDAPAGQNAVQYGVAADGRCVQSFPYDEAIHDWIDLRWGNLTGVQVLTELPADWTWPSEPTT